MIKCVNINQKGLVWLHKHQSEVHLKTKTQENIASFITIKNGIYPEELTILSVNALHQNLKFTKFN